MSVGEDIDEIAAHGLPETLEDGWVRLAAALPSADVLLDELQVRGWGTANAMTPTGTLHTCSDAPYVGVRFQ